MQANVCNRCLRFIPIETKMAQVKEFIYEHAVAYQRTAVNCTMVHKVHVRAEVLKGCSKAG